MYTLSLTDIRVYSSSDRPLYLGLLTDISGNSVADTALSLTDIPLYNQGDRLVYPALLTDAGVQCS